MSESSRGATRERKVAARLREIDRDRRALRNALDRFDGPQHFAATWASEDPDEINLRSVRLGASTHERLEARGRASGVDGPRAVSGRGRGGYYADYREEIDEWIDRVQRDAAEAEGAWRRRLDALA